jgi:hypothetical protein
MKQICCPKCSHVFEFIKCKIERKCAQCAKIFQTYQSRAVYCSRKCSRKAYLSRHRDDHRKTWKARYIEKRRNPEYVEKTRILARIYWAKCRSENPGYIIKNYLRSRIRRILRKKGTHVVDLTGCSNIELKKYLEARFKKGMTWENYGDEWVVDHIHPLASFDLTNDKQIKTACHFTNLQPLWKSENQDKAARITVPQMSLTV